MTININHSQYSWLHWSHSNSHHAPLSVIVVDIWDTESKCLHKLSAAFLLLVRAHNDGERWRQQSATGRSIQHDKNHRSTVENTTSVFHLDERPPLLLEDHTGYRQRRVKVCVCVFMNVCECVFIINVSKRIYVFSWMIVTASGSPEDRQE